MRRLIDAFRVPSDAFVKRLAIANLVANIGIVVTGGAVRLTGSGLGCPTWPRCTDDSFTPHSALGVHGMIEFGNRMLIYVVVAVAVATWLAVWNWRPVRRDARMLATVIALGVPFQGVIGGITVLTDLNPWVVALHLLLSMGLVAAATVLLTRTLPGPAAAGPPPPIALRQFVLLTYVVLWVVLYAGTIVTGSGPHAGDLDAPRNGLDPAAMSQLHADIVCLLIGLTVGCVFVLRALRLSARPAYVLLGLELAQGLIGVVQYATDLPIVLVGAHLLGAAVLVAAGTSLLVASRVRETRPATSPHDVSTQS